MLRQLDVRLLHVLLHDLHGLHGLHVLNVLHVLHVHLHRRRLHDGARGEAGAD